MIRPTNNNTIVDWILRDIERKKDDECMLQPVSHPTNKELYVLWCQKWLLFVIENEGKNRKESERERANSNMRQLKCAHFGGKKKRNKNAICSLNSVCSAMLFSFPCFKRYESSAWFVATFSFLCRFFFRSFVAKKNAEKRHGITLTCRL